MGSQIRGAQIRGAQVRGVQVRGQKRTDHRALRMCTVFTCAHAVALMCIAPTASAAMTAPPPLLPLENPTSVSPWIPINDQTDESDELGCGQWIWDRYPLRMLGEPTPPTPVDFTNGRPAGWRELRLHGKSLTGRYELANDWFGFACWLCGATDDTADATFGDAERDGLLYWVPDVSETGQPLPGLPTRVRIVSTAYLKGSIELDYGIVLAGETTRLAMGGLRAEVKTTGDSFAKKIDDAIAKSPSLIVVNPNAVHASAPQSTSLGVGLQIGTENGGQASVGWTGGGTVAIMKLNLPLKCIAYDCIAPGPTMRNWYFAQEAGVLIDAGLTYGHHSTVDATVEFRDFHFETMGCDSCSMPGVGGGPISTGDLQ